MIMNLGSAEIYEAIQQWVKNQGISVKHKQVEIVVKSGRKGNGPSAVVTITQDVEPEHTEVHTPIHRSSETPLERHIPAIDGDTYDLGDLS